MHAWLVEAVGVIQGRPYTRPAAEGTGHTHRHSSRIGMWETHILMTVRRPVEVDQNKIGKSV